LQPVSGADFTNPCGVKSSTYLWMGPNVPGPRVLSTIPLNLSCGGQVCFDLKIGIQSDFSPCEGPELPNEGVSFEYSIDGGSTWDTIFYFEPNETGSLNSAFPGSGDYTAWTNYCFNIPQTASTNNVLLRWVQFYNSTATFDHWGLDSISIQAFCGASSNLWSTGDTGQFIQTPVLQAPELYWVQRIIPQSGGSGAVDTCFDSLVVAPQVLEASIQQGPSLLCFGDSTNLNASVTGGTGQQEFHWSTGDSTSSIQNTQAGLYTVTVVDSSGCTAVDSLDVIQPAPVSITSSVQNSTCIETMDGAIDVDIAGGTVPYNIYWNDVFSLDDSISQLSVGSYYLRISDLYGCVFRDTLLVSYDNMNPVVGFNDTTLLCAGAPSLLSGGLVSGMTYTWNTGDTAFNILVQSQNSYSVTVTSDAGCTSSDSTFVLFSTDSIPQINLNDSTIICQGSSQVLDAGNVGVAYLWSTGETTQQITIDSAGYYGVKVTAINGCEAIDQTLAIIDLCLNVESLIDKSIKIYPNPVSNQLMISSANEGLVLVRLYDQNGRIVVEQKRPSSNTAVIDVSQIGAGIYFLETLTNSGEKKSNKVIKL